METCRSCTAPVLWALTEKGKSIPLDPEPRDDGTIRLELRAGKATAVVVGPEPDLLGTPRYVAHFATCPDAAGWRVKAQRHSPSSVAAGEAIRPKVSQLHKRILVLLRRVGPLTDDDIAAGLNMNPNTERPRRVELVELGMIEQVDTGRSHSGRPAARWGLKEEP